MNVLGGWAVPKAGASSRTPKRFASQAAALVIGDATGRSLRSAVGRKFLALRGFSDLGVARRLRQAQSSRSRRGRRGEEREGTKGTALQDRSKSFKVLRNASKCFKVVSDLPG